MFYCNFALKKQTINIYQQKQQLTHVKIIIMYKTAQPITGLGFFWQIPVSAKLEV